MEAALRAKEGQTSKTGLRQNQNSSSSSQASVNNRELGAGLHHERGHSLPKQ